MFRTHFRLSPYCVLWVDPDGQTVQLTHGLYGSRFEISIEVLRAIVDMGTGSSMDQACAALPVGARSAIDSLILERVLLDVDDAQALAANDPFRDRLTPLELAVHRGVNEGGFFPEEPRPELPPAPLKPSSGRQVLALDTHTAPGGSIELQSCLAQRQSIRSFGSRPIARRDIEAFLQLTARAYALREGPLGWASVRHYPSAGGRYPLELYLAIYNVESIEQGIYHYQAFSHSLERMETNDELHAGVAATARHMMHLQGDGSPAVLFLVTAVFARTCWKYRGMPYQAILLETGALYQTMYLAATALELAPCAVGAFPELAVAEMLGLDSRDEAQVGLFALGSIDEAHSQPQRVISVQEVRPSPFTTKFAIALELQGGGKIVLPPEQLTLGRDDNSLLHARAAQGRYHLVFEGEPRVEIRRLTSIDPVG